MLKLMSVAITTPPQKQKSNNAEQLLKQLLECVQDCQKRFGGKTELATEFESCVAGLCVTLETVLLFGLKHKSPHNQSSTIRQVSEIVANTLNIANESPSFWPFIYHHLTRHEQERYEVLKHIWTDTGRGRAWIRSSLNERSLERNFHTVLSNPEILKEYYEPWSILRDEEKNSMLPNMAAGLNSILFAINIDKAELNSGVSLRRETLKCRAEPIIEAPIPENKGKSQQKRKKKVARQFISFEDDDSYLSTSVPSSCSSTSSDSTSLGDSAVSKNKQTKSSLNQIDEEKFNKSPNKMENNVEEQKPKILRELSIENSGSREKYSIVVPESLTPVTQEEIGELTPVSVELNKHFDSSDNSDEILEVPTDISAVLSAVEIKNKEEIEKREEKILLLSRENESLKGQIKKYISAIRMLRNDDEEISDILEELEIEAQPNYKTEAKMFERKLVQVAEMHAELMDFNVMLQQNLCQKEMLLERLRGELGTLRGPMPSDEVNNEENYGSVNVWIPSAFLTGSGSDAHHVYQIFLRAGNDEWNIYRRYAQFFALHSDLKKLDPAVGTFDFPPKKSLRKRDSALVEDRRKRLQIYLRRVIAHWPELAHCNSRFLLEQHLSFFKDKREDLHNRNANPPGRNAVVSQISNHSGL